MCQTLPSAGQGRAGSAALLRAGARVPGALRRLLLLPRLEAGEQLDQPDVPLLGQEQEEEAQADDDDGDDPDPVEDDRAGVVINHCGHKKADGQWEAGRRPQGGGALAGSCRVSATGSSPPAAPSSGVNLLRAHTRQSSPAATWHDGMTMLLLSLCFWYFSYFLQ